MQRDGAAAAAERMEQDACRHANRARPQDGGALGEPVSGGQDGTRTAGAALPAKRFFLQRQTELSSP